MSFAVDTVIANARAMYPACSATLALAFLNEGRRLVFSRFHLQQGTQDINVSAGVQEYAYSPDMLKIETAHFYTADGVSSNLEPAEFSYLNKFERDWRDAAAGTPVRFYLTGTETGPMIGLDPKPGAATSGGFPIVRLHGTKVNVLLAGGTIYDDMPNTLAYEAYICFRYAESEHWQDVAVRKEEWERALTRLGTYLLGKNHHAPGEHVAEKSKGYRLAREHFLARLKPGWLAEWQERRKGAA